MTARVLVVGAGSIGARHARNLLALGVSVAVTDPDGSRAAAIDGAIQVPYQEDFDASGYDAVVVASPTRTHLAHAGRAVASGAKVLVEKPLCLDTDDPASLVAAGGERLAVAYNLRLHAPVQELVGLVHAGEIGEVRSARLWFGSYLPDWRPAVDYRLTYSASRDLGGGVLLDAIHELDLALWLLGPDLQVDGAFVGRAGDLDIDVEDTVRAQLRAPGDVPVTIELDYLARAYRRGIEVIGSEATAILDWARQEITVATAAGVVGRPAVVPLAASYELEAQGVVAWVEHGAPLPVSGDAGAGSVALARSIRAAA